MQKDIEAKSAAAKQQGRVISFENKMEQAATMLKGIKNYFQQSVLIVTDSWFGNNVLWSGLDRCGKGCFHLPSRMRTNITIYDFAPLTTGKPKAGRPRKYGERLGSVADCAARLKENARTYTVFLYGRKREVQAYSQTLYVENNEMPGTGCLGLQENTIRRSNDHRHDAFG